jgi:hypothetical protein
MVLVSCILLIAVWYSLSNKIDGVEKLLKNNRLDGFTKNLAGQFKTAVVRAYQNEFLLTVFPIEGGGQKLEAFRNADGRPIQSLLIMIKDDQPKLTAVWRGGMSREYKLEDLNRAIYDFVMNLQPQRTLT